MALQPGTSLGRFEIISHLGSGGMGEVYLAHDMELNRRVAIKVLPPNFASDGERLRRFRQEAQAASAINHPNIITIHEVGADKDVHFIATELVEGVTLRRKLRETGIELQQALDVATQIAGALDVAHRHGVVHRDIKPENLMVRDDGLVKVLDFGLAKMIEEQVATSSDPDAETKHLLTTPGLVFGTVNYMSPEQARGQSIDARSDLWSLGVVLYEMLTRRLPFAAENTSDLIAAILLREPAPPTTLTPPIPAEIERICLKMLRKGRDERYQTARDVLNDLGVARKTLERIASAPDTPRASDSSRTPKSRGEAPVNSIAVLPFANVSSDSENDYFCDGLAEEILNALAKIDKLKVAARSSAFSFKEKKVNATEVADALGVKTILEGSVRKSGQRLRITVQLINAADGYHLWSERYDREMQDIFDVQDEITLAVVNALKLKLLSGEEAAVLKRPTRNPEAYQYYLKGRFHWYKASPENLAKSRDYFQKAVDLDPAFALGYSGLADYYGFSVATGQMAPDAGWPKAIAAAARARELDDTLAEVHIGLAAGNMFFYRDWVNAESEIRLGLSLDPSYVEGYALYGFILVPLGRVDEAIAEGGKALELDPLSPRYNWYLGDWLYFARRYDAAIRQYEHAIELDPHLLPIYSNLGDAYHRLGKLAEAIVQWEKSLMMAGDERRSRLLRSTFEQKGFEAAVVEMAREQLERLKEQSTRGAYVAMIEYARCFVMAGDKEAALEWLAKASHERNSHALMINADPFYDSVRSDPRFDEIVRGIGLPA